METGLTNADSPGIVALGAPRRVHSTNHSGIHLARVRMQEASWRVTEFETYNTLTHIKSNPVSIYIVSLLLLVSGWRHWSPPITTPSFTARKCFLCRWWNMMESKVSEAWSVCFAKRIHHKNHAKSLGTVLDSVCIGGRIGIHCRIAEWSVSEKWITSRVQINVFKLFAHWPVSNPDVASKSRRPIQLVREIMLESGSMCVPMGWLAEK